ncbi:hypothetical protein EII29_09300 [Leptotrichia sp. OH3620_COT-345]|uniref:hypothetical protein n=1 Tax=Leptotrichia sp. OH3620_COT-345 TaxID=2491048 RepID=UPI000F650EFC|nr:hypothetical protein [Leptotrichia sp. OH3620_COT-345]RRD38886.1 hypothetical protein EII29_09300 [Leptotrichia sp. OH3620_COT-345]
MQKRYKIKIFRDNKSKFMSILIFMGIFTLGCAVKNPNPRNKSTTAVEKSDIVRVDIEKIIEKTEKEIEKTDKDKTLRKKIKSDGEKESEYINYYNKNKELKKFVVKHFAETGRLIQEFYIKDGKIYYLYQKKITYNRPVGWTKKKAKESGDTEYFDLKKSKNEEAKYYFDSEENLIRLISEDGKVNDNQEILQVIKNDLKDDYLLNIQNSKQNPNKM